MIKKFVKAIFTVPSMQHGDKKTASQFTGYKVTL